MAAVDDAAVDIVGGENKIYFQIDVFILFRSLPVFIFFLTFFIGVQFADI